MRNVTQQRYFVHLLYMTEAKFVMKLIPLFLKHSFELLITHEDHLHGTSATRCF